MSESVVEQIKESIEDNVEFKDKDRKIKVDVEIEVKPDGDKNEEKKTEGNEKENDKEDNKDDNNEGQALLADTIGTIKVTIKSIRAPKSYRRWVGLILVALSGMGPYFSFDLPSCIEGNLLTKPYDLTYTNYNSLYTVSYMPNLIVPLLVGTIADRKGHRFILTGLFAIITLGQLIFAWGLSSHNFKLMLAGRFLIGGLGTMAVIQNIILARWFRNERLSFALGFVDGFSRVGGVLVTPVILHLKGGSTTVPGMLAIVLCLIGTVLTLVVTSIDEAMEEEKLLLTPGMPLVKEQRSAIKELRSLPKIYWLLFGCVILSGCSFMNIVSEGSDMIDKRFGFRPEHAGSAMLWTYGSAIILSPLFGYISDRMGKRVTATIISTVLLVACHVIFAVLPTSKYQQWIVILPLVFMGIFYSIYQGVLYPCVSIVLRDDQMGMGLGLLTCTESLAFIISSLIIGKVQDSTANFEFGYFWGEIVLMIFGIAAIRFAFFTLKEDKDHNLEILQNSRDRIEELKEIIEEAIH